MARLYCKQTTGFFFFVLCCITWTLTTGASSSSKDRQEENILLSVEFIFPFFILQIFQTKAKLFFLLWSILNVRTMALLWNISWMGAIICAFRECGRSNTNQSVENWLGKCYWLDFNYCVQCVVVLTSFLSVGRNPKMPYFWLNVDPSEYSSGVSNSKVQILIVLSNTYNVLITFFLQILN